jgi:hypothetical protein
MKRIVTLVAIFAAPFVHADCLDKWLDYRSSKLYLSIDYSEGCYQGAVIINFTKFSKDDPHWPSAQSRWSSVPFDRECTSSKARKDGEPLEFGCRKDGSTPLAGATYRYKVVKPKYRCEDGSAPLPDRYFICVRGCAPAVPRRLEGQYSEGNC